MVCSPDIAEAVHEILEHGLLRVRTLAWAGRADRCGVEADHLHNLPSLLADFSEEKLRYYWAVERLGYMNAIPSDDLAAWEPLWEKLRPYAEPVGTPSAVR